MHICRGFRYLPALRDHSQGCGVLTSQAFCVSPHFPGGGSDLGDRLPVLTKMYPLTGKSPCYSDRDPVSVFLKPLKISSAIRGSIC